MDPASGLTAPFAVYVNITINIPGIDETSAAVEVVLVDTDRQPVVVPGPGGPNFMRSNQDVDFRRTVRPNFQQPPLGFPGTSNIVLNFPGGLPLSNGSTCECVVLLDGSRLKLLPQ